ncbi:MAG: hypothetical protein JO360_09250 [Acidobacteria bacterium]|nr:hypothetical protein [Acidobacteriota bacterium]
MSGRKIFFTIAIAFSLLCVLVVGFAFLFYRRYIAPFQAMKELPPEIKEARVLLGAELLSRTEFLKFQFGSVEDIVVGELDGKPGQDIGIAGRLGAKLVDREGQLKEQTSYQFERETRKLGPLEIKPEKMSLGDIRIVDLEGDGVCEYFGRGSTDGAAVFDHQGKALWSYGSFTEEKTSIDDLAVGDLDGDGVAEFLASWDGYELFDRSGVKRWTQAQKYTGQVEIVDADGDGKADIICDDGPIMTVRDAEGQVREKVGMPFTLGNFSLVKWDDKQPPRILDTDKGQLWLIGLDGQVVSKFDAPLSELKKPHPEKIEIPGMSEPYVSDTDTLYQTEGVRVRLSKDKDPYFAVVARFAVLDHSLFYVYDASGKLVYQEVMPEACSAIAVLKPEGEDGAQVLLVGGSETVWRYAARQ